MEIYLCLTFSWRPCYGFVCRTSLIMRSFLAFTRRHSIESNSILKWNLLGCISILYKFFSSTQHSIQKNSMGKKKNFRNEFIRNAFERHYNEMFRTNHYFCTFYVSPNDIFLFCMLKSPQSTILQEMKEEKKNSEKKRSCIFWLLKMAIRMH